MGKCSKAPILIAASLNLICALVLFGSQIALYFVGPTKGNYVSIINRTVVYASTGIWGGFLIFIASIFFLFDVQGANKMVKFSMAALSAIVGIVIISLFGNEINKFVQLGDCESLDKCGLFLVEILMVSAGVISILMSSFLLFAAIRKNKKITMAVRDL